MPPHLKPHEADSLKPYVEAYRRWLRSEEELVKRNQELLELQDEEAKEVFMIRQKYLKSRQCEVGLHQQAIEQQRYSLESIWQEVEDDKAFCAPKVLEKMNSLKASFKPLSARVQPTKAEHAREDAPTPEVSEPLNKKARLA